MRTNARSRLIKKIGLKNKDNRKRNKKDPNLEPGL